MTTATVMIGKREYTLAPLVFEQMERVWPLLQNHMDDKQLSAEELESLTVAQLGEREMQSSKDAIQILAVALIGVDLDAKAIIDSPLVEGLNVNSTPEAKIEHIALKIRRTMIAGEIPLLRTSILNLLVDSGLSTLGKVSVEVDQYLASLHDQINSMVTSQRSSGFSSLVESSPVAGT